MTEENKVENAPEGEEKAVEGAGVATPEEVANQGQPEGVPVAPEGEEVAEKAPEAEKPEKPVEPANDQGEAPKADEEGK